MIKLQNINREEEPPSSRWTLQLHRPAPLHPSPPPPPPPAVGRPGPEGAAVTPSDRRPRPAGKTGRKCQEHIKGTWLIDVAPAPASGELQDVL